jgi:hypothetical protein
VKALNDLQTIDILVMCLVIVGVVAVLLTCAVIRDHRKFKRQQEGRDLSAKWNRQEGGD